MFRNTRILKYSFIIILIFSGFNNELKSNDTLRCAWIYYSNNNNNLLDFSNQQDSIYYEQKIILDSLKTLYSWDDFIYDTNGIVIGILSGFEGNKPKYTSFLSAGAISTSEIDHLWSLPYSVNGSTLFEGSVGMWDGGHPLKDHQEFGNRVIIGSFPGESPYSIQASTRSVGDHPTNVVGIILSSGTFISDSKGSLNNGKIIAYHQDND